MALKTLRDDAVVEGARQSDGPALLEGDDGAVIVIGGAGEAYISYLEAKCRFEIEVRRSRS